MGSKLCDIKYEKLHKITGIWKWKQMFEEMSQLSARSCQISQSLIFNKTFWLSFHFWKKNLKTCQKFDGFSKHQNYTWHSKQAFKNLPNSTCLSWKLHNLQISNVQPHNSELYIEPLGKQIYILLTIQLYNCEQHG